MDIDYLDEFTYENNIILFQEYLSYIYLYLKECVPSVFFQSFDSNYRGLTICFLINLLCSISHKINGKESIKHILICVVSAISGGYLLLVSYENGAWSMLLFAGTSICIMCFIKPVPRLMGILGLCAVYVVFSELYVDSKQWHALRGSFMILLMKVISVAIDIDNKVLKSVSFFNLIGYLMTPCSIIYGPWLDYRTYDRWSKDSVITYKSIINGIKTYCVGIIFLFYSTCVSQLIFSSLPSNKWIRAYQDAQSFRFSHYFISYLSMSHLHLMNINYSHHNHADSFRCGKIVDPLSIELPRSLIDVVTLWNLPMHYWLKNYIYFPCRKYGRFVAILLTFAASSLLHGFNFALSGILISLGVYSYIEYVLRSQLSKSMNACVKARPCYDTCTHKFKKYSIITVCINLTFTGLAMFFLAYIAAMFDDSVGHSEGYSMRHTLNSWRRLSFSGHIIAFICYLVYLVFKCLF